MILIIDGWQSNITFSSCHMIPKYEKCGRLHGHSYAIHTKIHGIQEENGIVMDFSIIKNSLREIADELDHKVLLPKNCKEIELKIMENIEVNHLGKHYEFPKEDVALLDINNSSAENLSIYILKKLIKIIEFPENISLIEIGLDEGRGQGAWVKKEL